MHVYESLPELIGNTPILELKRSGAVWHTCAPIYAKLEYFNPLGGLLLTPPNPLTLGFGGVPKIFSTRNAFVKP